ncbi:MAG: hypothetical protein CMH64_03635 [Nanoarchaeota archaeon]|nr:hypothetical protein [Nanoarchaeota archaeon]
MLIAVFLLLANAVFAAAPNATTIPTQTWNGDFPWTLDVSSYFTDPESNPLTYSFARADNKSDITVTLSGSVATFTFVDEDFDGTNVLTFTATDNETTPLSVTSGSVSITKDRPAYCEVGDGTKIKIGDLDFDDDNYNIGDTVTIDVKDVEATTEDLDDVQVEICLYNQDEDKQIDCWDADGTQDINEDDQEDYDLEFDIPNDEDIGKDDNYLLLVNVKADDESGDNQCVQDSDSIDIERETRDVIIDSFSITPSTISAGETAQVSIRTENIGTKNEKDVYVLLRDDSLEIDYESNRYDLDDYKDSDNDHTLRFSVTISADAKAGDYVLQPIVYFDDEDETNSNKFVTLRVKEGVGGTTTTTETTVASLSLSTDTQIDAGRDSANLHLIVTNDGNRDLTGTLSFTPIGSWAQGIVGQPVSLHPGANNLYFTASLNEIEAGTTNSATVTINPAGRSNFDSKQFTLNFNVQGEENGSSVGSGNFGFLKGRGTGFWVVVDIILVIIGLLFLKAVFGKKTVA